MGGSGNPHPAVGEQWLPGKLNTLPLLDSNQQPVESCFRNPSSLLP